MRRRYIEGDNVRLRWMLCHAPAVAAALTMGLALGFPTASARAQLADNPGSAANPLPTGPQATPLPTLPESIVTSRQAYFSTPNTSSQASRLGLITFPNDWTRDNFAWSTLAYTHTFPGLVSWLSLTVGQYNLFSFDPNEFAANAQTSFISYSFAQTATQTFPNGGLGAYARVTTPD